VTKASAAIEIIQLYVAHGPLQTPAGSPEYARYRRMLLEFLYCKQAGDTNP
jgi:hypothetical protein